jgi:hypothetical protein
MTDFIELRKYFIALKYGEFSLQYGVVWILVRLSWNQGTADLDWSTVAEGRSC